MDVTEYQKLRTRAQLAMGRATRHHRSGSAEWVEAAQEFAFAKLMITLGKLREDYPELTDKQKRAVQKELELGELEAEPSEPGRPLVEIPHAMGETPRRARRARREEGVTQSTPNEVDRDITTA